MGLPTMFGSIAKNIDFTLSLIRRIVFIDVSQETEIQREFLILLINIIKYSKQTYTAYHSFYTQHNTTIGTLFLSPGKINFCVHLPMQLFYHHQYPTQLCYFIDGALSLVSVETKAAR